ncbi:MAG TPA: TIM-barrel domain-containing protein [Acidimicrobiales bacterium]|nr:TIM-barrel domain-containing protein [Acidimicrobiales bacterium]
MNVVEGARGYRIDSTWAALPVGLSVEETEPGRWVLRVAARGAERVRLTLPCGLDEHFAGLGEQFTQVDKRGRVIEAKIGASVNESCHLAPGLDGGYKVAPLWYSSAGYAAFVSGTRPVRIEFAVRDPHLVVIDLAHAELEVTVIEGPPAVAIETVTALTGRPPLAPPWTYAPWKASRGGHDAAVAEVERLRAEGVGAGAIWLDAHYEEGTNSGFLCAGTYELGEYPDISATVAALHELGVMVLTYVNPFLYRNTPFEQEAVARGFAITGDDGRPLYVDMLHPYEGDAFGILEQVGMHSLEQGAAMVDLTNPDALVWWQDVLRRILVDEGFDGWMEDFGEFVPPGARMCDGTGGDEAHNRYPLLYHQAAKQVVDREKPGAVFFARGGWLGAQRFAPAFWPGDQTRDWSSTSGIASVVPAGISLGLMGVAAWGPDIGGNMGFPALGGGLGGGSADKELWLRWCQLGAMSPVMRDHLAFHQGTPVDLWTDDETVDCWRRAAQWHTGLFPYLYSAAVEASSVGMPIMRGLMLHDPDDAEAWVQTSVYLLGDALLCAPVVEKGVRARAVYLPAGSWVDTWTGAAYEGGGTVLVDAPLDRWPVLQRAGTVVARLADVPLDLNDACYAAGEFDLELRVAPGPDGERRRLFDGTELVLDGASVVVRSPEGRARRCRTVTPDGRPLGEGTCAGGTELRLPAS